VAEEIKSTSLNQKAWRRLKRNKSAMFGLGVVVLSFFLSVFAYVVSPDNSPSGNEQVLQLETHEPGFGITMLKKRREGTPTGVVNGLLNGFVKNFEPIPVLDYKLVGDSVAYTEYRGRSFRAEVKKIALADLAGKPLSNINQKDFETEFVTTRKFWLGTDKFGRDILSRLLIGVRVSLSVGLIAVIISLIIGIFLGALAGYFRGWIDEVIMWVINVFWSIPTLLLAMGLYISAGSLIENKLVMIFIAVGLTMWVETARIVRGQVLSIREMEFVTAAKSLGFGHARIIFKHILPNIMGACNCSGLL
jgi:ABC-type dipeptide/oligopeptide/nickel transport system permease subunit